MRKKSTRQLPPKQKKKIASLVDTALKYRTLTVGGGIQGLITCFLACKKEPGLKHALLDKFERMNASKVSGALIKENLVRSHKDFLTQFPEYRQFYSVVSAKQTYLCTTAPTEQSSRFPMFLDTVRCTQLSRCEYLILDTPAFMNRMRDDLLAMGVTFVNAHYSSHVHNANEQCTIVKTKGSRIYQPLQCQYLFFATGAYLAQQFPAIYQSTPIAISIEIDGFESPNICCLVLSVYGKSPMR
jgi:hypothetical protein